MSRMRFGRNADRLVTADDALPGRADAITVTPTHPVLGNSIVPPFPDDTETIYLGMGCFWGAERLLWQLDGVYATAVGYVGGWTTNAAYAEVCTGRTGHCEAVMVVYRPAEIGIDEIMKAFWENHDPTTLNRQGNDVGPQYRSAVFTTTADQLAAVNESRQRYQDALTTAGYGEIVTQISPLDQAGDGVFYYAEDDHQAYLHKNPHGYCAHGFCQVGYADPT